MNLDAGRVIYFSITLIKKALSLIVLLIIAISFSFGTVFGGGTVSTFGGGGLGVDTFGGGFCSYSYCPKEGNCSCSLILGALADAFFFLFGYAYLSWPPPNKMFILL